MNSYIKIVLVGYMGSGKSSIGSHVSNKIGYEFIDLDDYIEEKEKLTVKEIFAQKGEIYFRNLENLALKELINLKNNLVISLGGGTPCYYDNYKLYHKKNGVFSFYLKTSINTLFNHLKTQKQNRPLISNLNDLELKEFIAKHLFERSPYYENVDYVLVTDDKSIESISDEILVMLT